VSNELTVTELPAMYVIRNGNEAHLHRKYALSASHPPLSEQEQWIAELCAAVIEMRDTIMDLRCELADAVEHITEDKAFQETLEQEAHE